MPAISRFEREKISRVIEGFPAATSAGAGFCAIGSSSLLELHARASCAASEQRRR
jgi:hypothetical protein